MTSVKSKIIVWIGSENFSYEIQRFGAYTFICQIFVYFYLHLRVPFVLFLSLSDARSILSVHLFAVLQIAFLLKARSTWNLYQDCGIGVRVMLTFGYTVKPVYNDHRRDPKFVVVVDRCSLSRGSLCYKKWKRDPTMVVGVDKWSLAQVWLYLAAFQIAINAWVFRITL